MQPVNNTEPAVIAGAPSLIKILVVEDSIDLRELFVRALKTKSCTVETAGNGDEALAKLEDGFRPDAILFDLNMPKMAGPEFLKCLKQNPNTASIKTIVISGIENLAKIAGEIGADRFLKKPVSLGDLYSALAIPATHR